MTKRRDLLTTIRKHAQNKGLDVVVKEGGNHTRVWVGNKYATLPRHNEIPDRFAKVIFKELGIEK